VIRKGPVACAAAAVSLVRKIEVTMLVTLVAILCNGPLCLEKVVTNNEQSGITMAACQVNGQIGIADWLANGPYHEWTLKGYKCVLGKYTPKQDA
jgi:hypothetical protein